MSLETCPLTLEDIQSELEAIREIAAKNSNKKMLEKALGNKKVETGIFGADMQVYLVNDGPVTIILDSKNKDF